MGAPPSQLFCFLASPGHSFLTPDFSFSSFCPLRACILVPWIFNTASSVLPGCFCCSPACNLWRDPGTLIALLLIKALLFPFSSSYGIWGCPSGVLHVLPCCFIMVQDLLKKTVSRWLPEWLWRRRTSDLWSQLSVGSSDQETLAIPSPPINGAIAVGKNYYRCTPGCQRMMFTMTHSQHAST